MIFAVRRSATEQLGGGLAISNGLARRRLTGLLTPSDGGRYVLDRVRTARPYSAFNTNNAPREIPGGRAIWFTSTVTAAIDVGGGFFTGNNVTIAARI